MKFMVVAGGTGGHFYPGLSVAKALLADHHNVTFVVRSKDVVIPMLEREKIPFKTIQGGGFRRSLTPTNFLSLLKLIVGFFQSMKHVLFFRPDVLLVMGGYLSVPPALAAWIFRIPILLQEQNVIPGWANRTLSVLSTSVAVGFNDSLFQFGTKAIYTGNPIRPEFSQFPEREKAVAFFQLETKKKTMLVFGGSLGARSINDRIVDALSEMSSHASQLQVLHFTGPQEEARIKEKVKTLPFTYIASGYCHDMRMAYAASDFIVCRSGASTISELLVIKKPTLLIPYPFSTGGHQIANARVLEKRNQAVVVEEKNLTKEVLKQHLTQFLEGEISFKQETQKNAGELADPLKAAERIKNEAVRLATR